MTSIKIKDNDSGQTIFNFIKKHYKTTKLSIIYKWFRTGKIKLNGKKIKDQKIKISSGDEILVFDQAKPINRDNFIKEDYSNINIIFEDRNILIVDKPANLEVHSPINENLDNKVKSYLFDKKEYNPSEENSFVVSHVHRLDKLTSGLVIYAKNKMALNYLLEAIQDKDIITKTYLAKINNQYRGPEKIEGWIKYDDVEQVAIFGEHEKKNGKTCMMNVKDLGQDILSITLLTGRKHQIRAALQYYKSPIENDFRYGGKKINSERKIGLLAYKLSFNNIVGELEYLNGQEFESQIGL